MQAYPIPSDLGSRGIVGQGKKLCHLVKCDPDRTHDDALIHFFIIFGIWTAVVIFNPLIPTFHFRC